MDEKKVKNEEPKGFPENGYWRTCKIIPILTNNLIGLY